MMQTNWSILLFSLAAFGQPSAKPPEFEVASIRLSDPNTPLFQLRTPNLNAASGTNLTFSNYLLRELIGLAYGVGPGQISGPQWLTAIPSRGQKHFDIVAKIPANASRVSAPLMLQKLLADRFKLVLHREQRVMPAYALVVTKGGLKMRQSDGRGEAECSRSLTPWPGVTLGESCRRMSAADLARQLQVSGVGYIDGPVVDKTGLTGTYDFELGWITRPEADAGSDGPTLFDALERQLGLKLEARKESVEVLVVDHCEKEPTEN